MRNPSARPATARARAVFPFCCVILVSCSGDPPSSTGSQLPAAGTVAAAGASAAGGGGAGAAGAGADAAGGGGRSAAGSGRPTAGAAAGPDGTGGGGVPGAAGAMAAAGASGAAAGSGGTTAGASGAAGASGMGGMAGVSVGTSGAGGAIPAPGNCEKGVVKASEVVFIGESFIAQSGAIPRMTTQLARQAGAVGMNESYRSFAVSGTQLTTGAIPMQYANAKRESPVRVVLMDGGGNDLLWGNRCQTGYDMACEAVVDVVDQLFKQLKTDGVKAVVYFFYPDPMGIGAQIKEAMDILRPEMRKLCDGSTDVRCVWVDQRESWEGNYEKFTSDGIHPTEAGSMASSQQIWKAMVDHCVAQ
jgi:lysophospholipase L1-like esterase